MVTRRIVTFGLMCLVAPALAVAQLSTQTDKKACQQQLEGLLLNKRVVAKVTFPASSQGIDLSLDGEWDQKHTSRLIKSSGGGIDVDEAATVTQVKLKDGLLEVQLNGGGFGTFLDRMTTSQHQQRQRAAMGKASGGSRVNLRFNKPVTCETLTDAGQMMGFLQPLLNVDALKMAAAQQAVPPQWEEAAAQKRAEVGMDKVTVFAIFGEPKQKQVDLAAEPPIEKWQYELPDLKTRVITFKEGKLVKVDEF